jgi:hypothetical protein
MLLNSLSHPLVSSVVLNSNTAYLEAGIQTATLVTQATLNETTTAQAIPSLSTLMASYQCRWDTVGKTIARLETALTIRTTSRL